MGQQIAPTGSSIPDVKDLRTEFEVGTPPCARRRDRRFIEAASGGGPPAGHCELTRRITAGLYRRRVILLERVTTLQASTRPLSTASGRVARGDFHFLSASVSGSPRCRLLCARTCPPRTFTSPTSTAELPRARSAPGPRIGVCQDFRLLPNRPSSATSRSLSSDRKGAMSRGGPPIARAVGLAARPNGCARLSVGNSSAWDRRASQPAARALATAHVNLDPNLHDYGAARTDQPHGHHRMMATHDNSSRLDARR